MAKKVTASPDLMASAQAAGLDWQAILNWASSLNWIQLLTLIRQLIDVLKGNPQPMFSAHPGGGCSTEQLDHAAAHFQAIQHLAECGEKCCGHP